MFQRDCCFLTGLTCLFISIFPLQKGLPQGFALRQTFFAFCIILFYIENRLQSHVPLFSDSSQHRRQLAAFHFIPTGKRYLGMSVPQRHITAFGRQFRCPADRAFPKRRVPGRYRRFYPVWHDGNTRLRAG